MSHDTDETFSKLVIASVTGGPRDGERIPLLDPSIPVELEDYLPWDKPLDALDTDMGPSRTFLVYAALETLPSGNEKWVLRWPRLDDGMVRS